MSLLHPSGPIRFPDLQTLPMVYGFIRHGKAATLVLFPPLSRGFLTLFLIISLGLAYVPNLLQASVEISSSRLFLDLSLYVEVKAETVVRFSYCCFSFSIFSA